MNKSLITDEGGMSDTPNGSKTETKKYKNKQLQYSLSITEMKMKNSKGEIMDDSKNSLAKDIVDYSMIVGKEKEIFEYLT